ncbi:hypothetical protein SQ11_15440, partial [Nitrosospira sp. NpAV]
TNTPLGFYQVHAFITGPGGVGMKDLGTLGGENVNSMATAVNASGQVAGVSYYDYAARHAFITGPNGDGMKDL